MNNHAFLPINIGDNHNKSTHGFLHRIILNNSALSDKYKSLTIINNTINYNTNGKDLKDFNDYIKKENKKYNLSKKSNKTNKNNLNINNDIDSDFSEIAKSISPSQQKKRIDNLKTNLKSEYKEARHILGEKSISSRERENEKIKNKNNEHLENDDIISSEIAMVNIEEISSSNKLNNNNEIQNFNINNNDYIDEDNNIKEKSDNENEQVNDKSTEENYDIINNDGNIKLKSNINNKNGYTINFDSPNKGVNLVKKGRKKISKNNLNVKFKIEQDIVQLYKLNDTSSNDLIFFFINEDTKKGMQLLNLNLRYSVHNINGKQISVYMFDMNNTTENNKFKEGISILIAELRLHKIIKVVLACGDENIFPFIEKLNSYSINFDNIIFCALPFGRSNDLSVQFGFGKSFSKINLDSFKKIIHEIIESISVQIDIWDLKLIFDNTNGGYISINNKFENYQVKTSSIHRGFISYFSLGYDSHIGFNLSKNKCSNSKLCYYTCYWFEAIKKSFCSKSLKLNQYLDSLYYINLHKNDSEYEDESRTMKEDHGQKITIFQTNVIDLNINQNDNISINNSKSDNRIVQTNESMNKKKYKKRHEISNEEDGENEMEESDSEYEYEDINSALKTFKNEKIMIKGEPLGLICQNIKYFCDGNISKWDSKKPKYGIQLRKKLSSDSVNKSNNELQKVRIYKYINILLLFKLTIESN